MYTYTYVDIKRVSSVKTGEEADEEEHKRTREIMAKYLANYRAHRKGITPKEMADYYSQWADSLKYEQVIANYFYFCEVIYWRR